MRRQLNILFNPNNLKDFIDFYNYFESYFLEINKNKKKFLEWDKLHNYLIDNCASIKIIFYIDLKKISNRPNERITSFSEKEKFEINEIISKNNNWIIICDTNNYNNFQFLIQHKEQSLIGSDNLNWDDYINESKKLLEYNILIEDFESLFSIFKNGESYETFDKMKLIEEVKNIELKSKNNQFIIKYIKIIKKSTNIIFGPKASGKTVLLESMYERYKNNAILFKPEDKKVFLDKYKNKEYFNDIKNDFKNKFNKIINYKEEKERINNLYNWAKQENNPFFKITEFDLDEPNIENNIIDLIKDNLMSLNSIMMNFNKIKDYPKEEYLKLDEIINHLINFWIIKNKKLFFYKLNKKIQLKLTDISIKQKRKIHKPNLGLKKLFFKRKNLIKNIVELNNSFF